MVKALEVEISALLSQYLETSETFDGDQVAELYCVPAIIVRGDGSIHCFQSREEIARFFQGVADTYQGEGATSGTMHDLEVVPIGERSALATVTWKNRRPDRSVARQFRNSYNVVRFAEGWRILAATAHLRPRRGSDRPVLVTASSVKPFGQRDESEACWSDRNAAPPISCSDGKKPSPGSGIR
jgi:ketosteroid isomerase-like protein